MMYIVGKSQILHEVKKSYDKGYLRNLWNKSSPPLRNPDFGKYFVKYMYPEIQIILSGTSDRSTGRSRRTTSRFL